MQRVNEAYEKRNLLQLLKLQLELEHIDQTTVNNISEDRLKHYNKILKEQLAKLEQEIFHVEGGFMAQFGINPFDRVSPGTIMRDLATEIVGIQHTILDLKKDVIAFEDIKKVKVWLKKVQREAAKMDDYGDCPF
ncbi:heat shock protein DnaJ domain-containing protein [mine drainage metagenome]|uniref:Heat shock protein DnaJ domain-containing protein n=1 Tax=mine drainage metagenome TaxID=410659 RepID=T1D907_9ZZZZ